MSKHKVLGRVQGLGFTVQGIGCGVSGAQRRPLIKKPPRLNRDYVEILIFWPLRGWGGLSI